MSKRTEDNSAKKAQNYVPKALVKAAYLIAKALQ